MASQRHRQTVTELPERVRPAGLAPEGTNCRMWAEAAEAAAAPLVQTETAAVELKMFRQTDCLKRAGPGPHSQKGSDLGELLRILSLLAVGAGQKDCSMRLLSEQMHQRSAPSAVARKRTEILPFRQRWAPHRKRFQFVVAAAAALVQKCSN
uniref:(northern house mosquito) hypothetical protein n=1 Tax=Culex pipiens TaxID=7175 RepID=A0A8D8L8X1_CULPI